MNEETLYEISLNAMNVSRNKYDVIKTKNQGTIEIKEGFDVGAWDVGHFDNDSALDWVQDIIECNDLKEVKKLIKSIAKPKGFFGLFNFKESYIDADQACCGLVAGEVIATIIGNPSEELPDELMEWIQGNHFSVNKSDIDLARKAIVKIREDSELRELWEDSDELERWKQKVEDLESRLNT